MNRTGQRVRSLIAGYLAIGVLIYLSQSLAGRSCDSLLGERRATGRGSLVMTVILWPSDLASHVRSGGAPLSEYFVPTRCIGR
jgi:hypothetical protein